jgi:hypothetical protein
LIKAIHEAKIREKQAEEHMEQLSQRQIGRLNLDLQSAQKNIDALNTQVRFAS